MTSRSKPARVGSEGVRSCVVPLRRRAGRSTEQHVALLEELGGRGESLHESVGGGITTGANGVWVTLDKFGL
jgi:hypothetical protein